MYYAWIEDLANVSGLNYSIYNAMMEASFREMKIYYNGYYHDYTGINWKLYL